MTAEIINFDTIRYRNAALHAVAQNATATRIVDRPDSVEIVTSLINADEDDIVIGILDNVLTVGAKLCSDEERDFGDILVVDHVERVIERSFALPAAVNQKTALATYDGRTLRITLRKA